MLDATRALAWTGLLALALTPAAAGQTPAGQGIVTIGTSDLTNCPGPDCGTVNAVGGANAEAAVTSAIALLASVGSGGGEIVFLPGVYFFRTPVRIGVDVGVGVTGIRLRGSHATVLVPDGDDPIGLFDVTVPGFALVDLVLEERSIFQTAPIDRTLVRVVASHFTLEDCLLSIPDQAGPAGHATTLVQVGDGTTPDLRSVRVRQNTFAFGHLDTPGAGPAWIGLLARGLRGLQVRGNHFRGGGDTAGFGYVESCIRLEGVDFATILSNQLQDLGTSSDPVPTPLIDLDGASSHVVCTGNYVTDCVALRALNASSSATTITGNGFGCRFVTAEPQPREGHTAIGGQEGRGLIVFGNQFHGMGRQGFPTLDLTGHRQALIVGNRFFQSRTLQVRLVDSDATQLASNQFLQPDVLTAAIELDGGQAYFLYGNSALGNLWANPFWSVVTPNSTNLFANNWRWQP